MSVGANVFQKFVSVPAILLSVVLMTGCGKNDEEINDPSEPGFHDPYFGPGSFGPLGEGACIPIGVGSIAFSSFPDEFGVPSMDNLGMRIGRFPNGVQFGSIYVGSDGVPQTGGIAFSKSAAEAQISYTAQVPGYDQPFQTGNPFGSPYDPNYYYNQFEGAVSGVLTLSGATVSRIRNQANLGNFHQGGGFEPCITDMGIQTTHNPRYGSILTGNIYLFLNDSPVPVHVYL